MLRRISLDPHDAILVREALAYMGRRLFDPADSARLTAVEDRVEELLLEGGQFSRSELVIDDGEVESLVTALRAYAEELSHPGSDPSNRRRVAQITNLLSALGPPAGFLAGLRRLLRKIGL